MLVIDMNAYRELFEDRISFPASEPNIMERVKEACPDCEIKEATHRNPRNKDDEGRIIRRSFKVTPNLDSAYIQNWLDSVKWAEIEYDGCRGDKPTRIFLKPNRTKEEERTFLIQLQNIDYDDGYGSQHLFGNIVFKDNSWMERGEYDGSEWWTHKSVPQEPDWEAKEAQWNTLFK